MLEYVNIRLREETAWSSCIRYPVRTFIFIFIFGNLPSSRCWPDS